MTTNDHEHISQPHEGLSPVVQLSTFGLAGVGWTALGISLGPQKLLQLGHKCIRGWGVSQDGNNQMHSNRRLPQAKL